MKKARFVLDMLKYLEKTAKEIKESGTTHGNHINKVVRDVERKSYKSGFFHTGKISEHTVNADGSPYIIQDSPNWRVIFQNYLNSK